MDFNEYEEEILSMINNNCVDISRIDFLLKNGADVNKRAHEYYIATITDSFVSWCFWDINYTEIDFFPILRCFVNNGLDLHTYGPELLGALCFVSERNRSNVLQIAKYLLDEMKKYNFNIDDYDLIYEKRDDFSWSDDYISGEQWIEEVESVIHVNYGNLIPLFVENYLDGLDITGITSFEHVLYQKIIDIGCCGEAQTDTHEKLVKPNNCSLIFVTEETNLIIGKYGALYLNRNEKFISNKSSFASRLKSELLGEIITDFKCLIGPEYNRFIEIHFSNSKILSLSCSDRNNLEIELCDI